MPILADDDVIMHRDAERAGDVDDLLGHLRSGGVKSEKGQYGHSHQPRNRIW